MNGTSAPAAAATLPISSSSVETITLLTGSLAFAASIVYAINGRPASSLIFFRLIPFDPPLAGIIASVLFELIPIPTVRADRRLSVRWRETDLISALSSIDECENKYLPDFSPLSSVRTALKQGLLLIGKLSL